MPVRHSSKLVFAATAIALSVVASACGASSNPTAELDMSTNSSSANTTTSSTLVEASTTTRPNILHIPREVHAYYYAWYGNPAHDGAYSHWTHPRQLANGTEGPKRVAPDDPGVAAWPQLGLYSSNDLNTIDTQMRQIHEAGIDVAIVSWWGQGSAADAALPHILDKAALHNVRVTVVMEPNWNSIDEFVGRIHYLIDKYGAYKAWYRNTASGNRPMLYTYDPLWRHRNITPLPTQQAWRDQLAANGAKTLRGTAYDTIIIAQVENDTDVGFAAHAGFDGVTTYLANFDLNNFPGIARAASDYGIAFIPSVGPGYDDTRIRPWNAAGIRKRDVGNYYTNMVAVASQENPRIIAVTSFNEWHEGTQIEPAVDHTTTGGVVFNGYGTLGPDGYLKLTKQWADEFRARR